jgi:hypothetical protein
MSAHAHAPSRRRPTATGTAHAHADRDTDTGAFAMEFTDRPEGRDREVPALLRPSWGRGPAYQQGRWGYVLAWALGVPIPILFLVYLLRGCS